MADQGSQGRLSPWLRRKRIDQVRSRVTGRILDFGCGLGEVADLVGPEDYLGYDADAAVIEEARTARPRYTFVDHAPLPANAYDSVVCLAVLEHVQAPAAFLRTLGEHLAPGGAIMLTTPHPRFEIVHTVGARVGVFSLEAHDEHEDLLDEDALRAVAHDAGLRVTVYRRFLLGANQLLVLTRRADA